MTDALSQALANAAANAPKGETLHLENLDSIADPNQDEFIAFDAELQRQPSSASSQEAYRLSMEAKYKQELLEPSHTDISYISIDSKLNGLTSAAELTRLRLDALADMITEISTTITTAAQSMPQEPNHKHRSLHEWDDQYLINELVERENDLMPFYYELLKRIGSPDLHSLVMSSMQGKNSSMIVLAQLCAALGTVATQPQPQPQAQSIPEAEHQRLEQMSPLERQHFAQKMNTVVPKSPYFETPPTYNPYFKER